jgi:hypothetical protein
MRKTLALLAIVLIAATAVPAGAAEVNGDQSGTWTAAGSPYVATGNVTVPAGESLTIEPGVEVRFSPGTGLSVHGVLTADGTESGKITFTTNEEAEPGKWTGIEFRGGSSGVLDNCRILYAGWDMFTEGSYAAYVKAAVVCRVDAAPTISNCEIAHVAGDGVRIHETASPTIVGNVFNGVGWPVYVNTWSALPAEISGNTYTAVEHFGIYYNDPDVPQGEQITWPVYQDGLPYRVEESVDVETGASLTVEPGVVVKSYGGNGIVVKGSLQAQGSDTEPIVFTSALDDENGGDTNGDASETTAEAGQWTGIEFREGSTGLLDHCRILYAGWSMFTEGSYAAYVDAAIVCRVDAAPTISSCEIANVAGDGIRIHETASPTIIDNDFNGVGWPVYVNTWSALPANISGNTYASVQNLGIYYNDPDVPAGEQITWPAYPDGLPYRVEESVDVEAGASLTIEPGVVVKSYGGNGIVVKGSLEAQGSDTKPVVFTSSTDDENGGDTNGDGTETTAEAGHWAGIEFREGSSGLLDHCRILYAGWSMFTEGTYAAYVDAAVVCRVDAAPTISSCEIANIAGDGVRIHETASPTIIDNDFNGVGWPVYANTWSALPADVSGNAYTDVQNFGIYYNDPDVPEGQQITWPAYPDGLPYRIEESVDVETGASLTIQPGVVVKSYGGNAVVVKGSLEALGTATEPIIFTSAIDDENGGDTNGDGDETTAGAGQWSGIEFRAGSSGALDHCRILYAGWSMFTEGTYSAYVDAAVVCRVDASPAITNSEISQIAGDAVRVLENANPLLSPGLLLQDISGFGVRNESTAEIDARNAWWGDASGPTHSGNVSGTGFEVSDLVDYAPYLAAMPDLWVEGTTPDPPSPPSDPVEADITVPDDYATIQEALDAAQAGQVVGVAAGTYVENISLKADVSLIGAGAEVTTIDGGGSDAVWTAEGARIAGFTITNGGDAAIFAYGNSPTIEHCIISGSDQGIATNQHAVIRSNLITGNTEYGIFGGSDGKPDIANNLIVGNGSDASGVVLYQSGGAVTNNVIDANGMYGISASQPSTPLEIDIRNNIVTRNGWYGISAYAFDGELQTVDYNNVWENAWGDYDEVEAGPGSMTVDPLFVAPMDLAQPAAKGSKARSGRVADRSRARARDLANRQMRRPLHRTRSAAAKQAGMASLDGDYHLQAASLCVNAGDPADDYLDTDGSRNDMGAYGGQAPFQLDVGTDGGDGPVEPGDPEPSDDLYAISVTVGDVTLEERAPNTPVSPGPQQTEIVFNRDGVVAIGPQNLLDLTGAEILQFPQFQDSQFLDMSTDEEGRSLRTTLDLPADLVYQLIIATGDAPEDHQHYYFGTAEAPAGTITGGLTITAPEGAGEQVEAPSVLLLTEDPATALASEETLLSVTVRADRVGGSLEYRLDYVPDGVYYLLGLVDVTLDGEELTLLGVHDADGDGNADPITISDDQPSHSIDLTLAHDEDDPGDDTPLPSGDVGPLALDLNDEAGDQEQRQLLPAPSAGDQVVIDIVITEGGSGAAGFEVDLGFDPQVLEFTGFSPADVFSSGMPITTSGDGTVNIGVAILGGTASKESGSAGQATFTVLDGFTDETRVELTSGKIGFDAVEIGPGGSYVLIGGEGPEAPEKPNGDFNGDGMVGFLDFISFAQAYGSSEGDAKFSASYDMNQDGAINFFDFITFAQLYGKPASKLTKPVSGAPGRAYDTSLALLEENAAPGARAYVVRLSGEAAIEGFGFTVKFDPAALEFTGAENLTGSLLGKTEAVALQVGHAPGMVMLADVLPASVADGDLVRLTFRNLGGVGPVTISEAMVSDPSGNVTRLLGARLNQRVSSSGLHQNYPNPFNPETVVPFDLSVSSHVRISVYSATGQEIAVLISESRPAGRHIIRWNGLDSTGRAVGSGLYLVRMEAGDFQATRKVMLLR